MNANEILISIMKLAISINNKDENGVVESISKLKDAVLTEQQKQSLFSYEDSIITKLIEDKSMVDFLSLPAFDNQNIFDAKYVKAILELNLSDTTSDKLLEYLNSDISFSDPIKQYRYCFSISNKAIQSGNIELMEKAIEKTHQFTISQPDFIAPEYVQN